ncbi:Uncharacterised protein [Oligella urethralis]|uniref:hypothetical protein n=1 Tax=Oligella urethralis TaxID=90245 RepID=UPI000E08366C|nr:hypothetical protein [Oligella urethralis]SUA59687.1 Uncharacterised protein [Oligella urethralis]
MLASTIKDHPLCSLAYTFSGLFLLGLLLRPRTTDPQENVLGWIVCLVLWLINFLLIFKYYFLPNKAILRLKKADRKVAVEVVEDHVVAYREQSSLLNRRLTLRFNNLSGTAICHEFHLTASKRRLDELTKSEQPTFDEYVAAHNQLLEMTADGAQRAIPLYINQADEEPSYCFADEEVGPTTNRKKQGAYILLIAAMFGIVPLLFLISAAKPLTLNFLDPWALHPVFAWLLCAMAFMATLDVLNGKKLSTKIFSKANNRRTQHTFYPILFFGLPAITQKIKAKRIDTTDDVEHYQVTLEYVDQQSQIQVIELTATVDAGIEQLIHTLPERRKILYLAQDPRQIIFLDTKNGEFYHRTFGGCFGTD